MKQRIFAIAALAAAIATVAVLVVLQTSTMSSDAAGRAPAPADGRPIDRAGPSSGVAEAAVRSEAVSPDCLELLSLPEGSSRLMAEQKRLRIHRFLSAQADPLVREIAADIAGYRDPRFDEAALLGGLPVGLFWTYGTPSPPGKRELSAKDRQRLAGLLEREGVAGLLALDDPALFQTRWEDTTLAGHLIRNHRKTLLSALPTAKGLLPIGLHELALAIETGIGAADFATLLDASDEDPAATWRNGANLAKGAAIRGRPEILRLLLAKGVDPTADRLWNNVRTTLDDLAAPPRRLGDEVLAEVAEQLILAGDQPRLPSTLAALARVPTDVRLPPLHAASEAVLPLAEDAARTVSGLDAEWSAKQAAASRSEARCASSATVDALADLDAGGGGLALKERQQEALDERERRLLALLEDVAADGDPPAPADAVDSAWQAWVDALSEERWEDAIANAHRLGGSRYSALLFRVAAQMDAPLAVLQASIVGGGLLPEDAVLLLAKSRRGDAAALADALETYGLDPHYADAQGRNGFAFLADDRIDEGAWRFGEYLASRSVTPKPSALGLDPLDRTLARLVDGPRGTGARIRFARFLIDHGAPVEPSHLERAAMISLANQDAHRRLIDAVPELAS